LTPLRLDLTDEAQFGDIRARHPLDEGLATAVSPSESSEQAAEAVLEDETPEALPKVPAASPLK
jgi:hypothetical protein